MIGAPIENTQFPDAIFDVVHSCHTIQYLASPMSTLAYHWRVLKPDGLLIIDAPNIALIDSETSWMNGSSTSTSIISRT